MVGVVSDARVKLSILLPTRNGMPLLAHAARTVLAEPDADVELVVSDNNSDGAVARFVEQLNDPRVVYSRSDRTLSVTESWNRALALMSGDYFLMLGDDDGLVPGAVTKLRGLVDTHTPDLVYSSAYLLVHPGAQPEHPNGRALPYGYATFLNDGRRDSGPFFLDEDDAHAAVEAFFWFRCTYGFNMQFVTLRRSFAEEIAAGGELFRSPFPDYYATNLAFFRARRLLVTPDPLTIIGVSRSSFGAYSAARRDQAGAEYLHPGGRDGGGADPEQLPGSPITQGWLAAAKALVRDHPDLPFRPSLRRYRALQVHEVAARAALERSVGSEQVAALERRLTRRERLAFRGMRAAYAARGGARLAARVQRALAQTLPWDPPALPGCYADVEELAAALRTRV